MPLWSLVLTFSQHLMKRHLLICTARLSLGLALGTATLLAQSPQPSPPSTVKSAPPQPAPTAPRHLVFILETYRLKRAALDALHEKSSEKPNLYEGVRALVSSGAATLEDFCVIPTRSGQRAGLFSADEFIHATNFTAPTAWYGYGYPTTFEMRPLGERLEIDTVLGPDGDLVDLNLSYDFTRFVKWTSIQPDAATSNVLQPIFVSRKIGSSLTCRMGVPALVGTINGPHDSGVSGADDDGSVSITFARVQPSLPSTDPASPQTRADPDPGRRKNIRMVFRIYSLPRPKARDFLAETVDADRLRQMVTALPDTEFKLERVLTMTTNSGQRATLAETAEFLYGTEFDPPTTARSADTYPRPIPASELLPPIATSFEMRHLGWRIEVDPVISPDERAVDLNLAPEYTQFRGNIEGHPLLARHPDVPIFSAQKILTAISTTVGRQALVGSINPPRETGVGGRKDDGRTWLVFLRTTLD